MPGLTRQSARQGVAWSPWHGCRRVSEGCAHCFVYYLDRKRADRDAGEIYRTKTGFNAPVKKDRSGAYKVPPGTVVSTCFNSDFFLEDADAWRPEAWDMIRSRHDLVFLIPTKRIRRFRECAPPDWGEGWDRLEFCGERQALLHPAPPSVLAGEEGVRGEKRAMNLKLRAVRRSSRKMRRIRLTNGRK